jgi:TRAP-type mannitol/chloroaromatic compound transport system permease small subunit
MKVVKWINDINEKTGSISAWIIIPLIFIVVYEVVMRHFFNAPTGWGYDTLWMLYSAQFMLGGAYTLLKKAHVRIDIVYNLLSPRGKLIFDAMVYSFVIFGTMILLTWAGIKFAKEAWITGEKLSTTNWFFPSGPSKTVIPVALFLVSLQSLADLIRIISELKKRKER